MVVWKQLFATRSFALHLHEQQTELPKNDLCHMTRGGLSSFCAKLEPARSKMNELCPAKIYPNSASDMGGFEAE